MRRLLLVSAAVAAVAAAQPAEPPTAQVEQIALAVESAFDCDVSIHGEPRIYELSSGWYVTYSAAGGECDAASDMLRVHGAEHEVLFSRRPDQGQLRVLVGEMIRSAERTTGCRISIGSTSMSEPTGQWTVHYIGSGTNCGEAERELAIRGAEFDILFLRRRAPGAPRDFR